jgi:hypothetical protein
MFIYLFISKAIVSLVVTTFDKPFMAYNSETRGAKANRRPDLDSSFDSLCNILWCDGASPRDISPPVFSPHEHFLIGVDELTPYIEI